jgi:hypothetical protein
MPSVSEEERNWSLLLNGASTSFGAEVDESDQRHSSSGGSSLWKRGRDPDDGTTSTGKTPTARV